MLAGQHDLAIEHIQTALRLNPRERIGTCQDVLGRSYFLRREYGEAASRLLLAIQENPGLPNSYRFLAACYAHTGRREEARAVLSRLHAITPEIVPTNLPLRNPEDRELLLSGLRLAMGEAT